MARPRKPLDQLSPAYRKRIERAEAAGKSRAEARGHKEEQYQAYGRPSVSNYRLRAEEYIYRWLSEREGREVFTVYADERERRAAATRMIEFFGVAGARRIVVAQRRARREYLNSGPDAEETRARGVELGDEYDRSKRKEMASYVYIPWRNPPDYAEFLFYH